MVLPPILLDQDLMRRRLAERERELGREIAELESAFQRFESVERPAYEHWKRLEFGPRFADLDALYERIRLRRLIAWRIEELVDRDGYHPREARHLVESGSVESESAEDGEEAPEDEVRDQAAERPRARDYDADEIEARRRAKREAKRANRKEARAARRRERGESPDTPAAPDGPDRSRRRILAVYRAIVRQLHPDSSEAAAHLLPARARELWHEVQAAYRSADLERLLAIATWLRSRPEAGIGSETRGPATFAERTERVRALERARRKLEKKIAALREHPAWDFGGAGGSARRKLAKRVAREIELQFAQAQEIAEALEDFFESIGPPRAPRERPTRASARRKRR